MEHTALQLLEDACEKSGSNIALFDEEHQYTYLELRQDALKTANYIVGWNVARRAVIVLSERDARCVVLFWGILYSGNFYVPWNYNANKGVFSEVLRKIQPVGILSCDQNEEVEELCHNLKIKYTCLRQILDSQLTCELKKPYILENDPAYMVFTSGSTGMPKGIIKSHHSIMSFVKSFLNRFPFEQEDVFGNQAEFDYDVAAKDIYLTVAVGAHLGIIPRKCFLMPAKLMKYLQDWKINVLIWAVAAVRLVAQNGCLEKYHEKLHIKKVFFSGEELKPREIGVWVQYLPDALYVNLYAPSEVTGNCLYYIVDNNNIPLKLPLGVPFDNTEIMVLNEDMKPVMDNEQGEIYVRGPFLSMGYYSDMEQTKEKFIQNPMHNDYMDVMYRTGDIAEYDKGELYFEGRKDYQIKFMGHRIELFEIESVFLKQSGVLECCCIKADESLVMFYKGRANINDTVKKMMKILPKYKIPQKFIEVIDLPQNARGKIDRGKLLEQYKEIISEEKDTRNIKEN